MTIFFVNLKIDTMKKIVLILMILLSKAYAQNDFMLGVYWPPSLVTPTYDTNNLYSADILNFQKIKDCNMNLVIDGMNSPFLESGYASFVNDNTALIEKKRLII